MMDLINNYIDTRLLIIAVLVYLAIEFIKQIPAIKQMAWVLPLFAWLIGVVMTLLYLIYVLTAGWSGATFVIALIQGTFTAGLAVFSDQVFKQIAVKRLE